MANFPGQLGCHYPANKLSPFARSASFIFPSVLQTRPIPGAITVLTDGSGNGRAAAHTPTQTLTKVTGYSSAQRVELSAVTWALHMFSHQSLNLYTDSHNVFSICKVIETAHVSSATTEELFPMFHQLKQTIPARQQPLYTGHITAHSDLPGPLSAGNAAAEAATQPLGLSVQAFFATPTSPMEKTMQSHALHLQNGQSLRHPFKITREQARQIVKQCAGCTTLLPEPHLGVNPRGLLPNHIWQMDVTHIPSFKRTPYVHTAIVTKSGFFFATACSGEATEHVISHSFQAFATMGIPKVIKTENGPGYTSKAFKKFA